MAKRTGENGCVFEKTIKLVENRKTLVPFPRREVKLNAPPTPSATGLSASLQLAGALPLYAAGRRACRFGAMMWLSAWILPNRGMPGRTKPGRYDEPNILAFGYLPSKTLKFQSSVLGSA